MSSIHSIPSTPATRSPESRKAGLIAAVLIAGALPTSLSAAGTEFSYQYFRFEPVKAYNSNGSIQLAEFTFSYQGTVLNLNNRDGSGVDVVPVSVTSGGQDPNGAEGPGKVIDGKPLVTGDTANHTKWYQGDPFNIANALTFDFGAGTPVTVDAYNFCTGNDSVGYNRTPVSWRVSGSNDGATWDVLDIRSDYPVVNANYTYQAGFDLPVGIPPVINSFSVLNTPFEGTAAIIKNGESVTLEWDTQYGDTVTLFEGPGSTTEADFDLKVVSPPDNSTTAYTLVVESDPLPPAIQTQLVRTVEGGTETFQYVRFKITQRRGGGTAGLVQMGEFEFYNGDSTLPENKVPVVLATNPGGSNSAPESTSNEKVEKLVDGDYGTKWLDGNNQAVIFDFGSQVSFDRYLFVTGNDAPDRDAVMWSLEGSNDGSTWELIENVDFTYPTPLTRGATTREIPLPGASLPAQIDLFTGNTATLIAGEPLTLTYATQAASTVSIDQGVPALGSTSGSVVVMPTEDTLYTLTAESGLPGNSATATFQVTVIDDPGVDSIAYDDFTEAGAEIALVGSSTLTTDRLRITPELGGQQGAAWFLKKQDVTGGFEASFGMSLNQEDPNGFVPADGLAFVVQNAAGGTTTLGAGENGVAENALSIKFKSFGFTYEAASALEVRVGTTVIASRAIGLTPGVELYGVPGHPYTLGSLATDPAYRIRVVYMPGDLDVYFDGIAIVQNVDVDLEAIGAADAEGKSYFGFTARTGGNIQNSDITDWKVALGDFSALPPFGMVKTLFKDTNGDSLPDTVDLVWNSEDGIFYDVTRSLDLDNSAPWELISSEIGVDGQLGISINYESIFDPAVRAFFRIEESEF
ncbi:discoidin domain-containing protein [Luteolibacter marinus]|uniref:discoidin domain-containing protein n=1 Tax=Luteolibacter marinus TaxID=2776705 RepID=UPI0018686BE0|nr:discoidin domain-containing protein [Luteolibacter marinus]